MATETLADPNTVPTTVGIVAKKPPLAAPLMITKAMSGPRLFDTGQITNMLAALSSNETKSMFSGPSLSASRPKMSRPMADEKLKPATRPVLALEERPRLPL